MTPDSPSTERSQNIRSSKLPTPFARFCDAVIEAGILLALAVAPLYFNPETQHTFEPDKAAMLRSIVLVSLLAWSLRRMDGLPRAYNETPRRDVSAPVSDTENRGGISSVRYSLLASFSAITHVPLAFPVLLLLAFYLLSTATSVLPNHSFWGSYERRQGLYLTIAYIALFFLARHAYRTRLRPDRIVNAILVTSLPVAIYAILQHYGLDPLQFQADNPVTMRAISSLGNPIFLGAYLVMVIPLTGFRIYQEWQLPSGISNVNFSLLGLYAGLLGTQVLAIWFTQSRGPILGLMIGLAFGICLAVSAVRRRRHLLVTVLIVVVFVGVPVLATATGRSPAALGRLGQLADPSSFSGRQRLLIWEGVLDLVTTNPVRMWVGYGPETLRHMVGPHMPSQIAALAPDEGFDRAHNAVLDLWVSAGLFGVAAYLLTLGATLYYGVRTLGIVSKARERALFLILTSTGTVVGAAISWFGGGRHWIGVGLPLGLLSGVVIFVLWQGFTGDPRRDQLSQDHLLAVALLAAIVGHLIETLVGMAIVATHTLFWIYAALIAVLSDETGTTRREGGETRRDTLPTRSAPLPCSIYSLLTGVSLGLFGFPLLTTGQARGLVTWGLIASATLLLGWVQLSSDRTGGEERVMRYVGLSAGAVLAPQLLNWLPWPPLDITHSTAAIFAYVVLAILALAVALVSADWAQATIHRLPTGRKVIYGSVAISIVTLIWLTNVKPMRADVYYKAGLGLSAADDLQNAVHVLERSVTLNPEEGRYYSGIGAAYAQMAHSAEEQTLRENWLIKAETSLRAATRLNPYRADHLRNLGLLYRVWAGFSSGAERTSYLRRALTYYDQAAMHNPVSVRTWREWGEIHAELDEWDLAIVRYEQSLLLNDGFVETWLLLARARLQAGDYEEALQAYAHAIALNEVHVLEQHEAAVTISPDEPLPHQALALVYAALGRNREAMAEADIAHILLTENPPDWSQFLRVLEYRRRSR